jgi:hypothetical protein
MAGSSAHVHRTDGHDSGEVTERPLVLLLLVPRLGAALGLLAAALATGSLVAHEVPPYRSSRCRTHSDAAGRVSATLCPRSSQTHTTRPSRRFRVHHAGSSITISPLIAMAGRPCHWAERLQAGADRRAAPAIPERSGHSRGRDEPSPHHHLHPNRDGQVTLDRTWVLIKAPISPTGCCRPESRWTGLGCRWGSYPIEASA